MTIERTIAITLLVAVASAATPTAIAQMEHMHGAGGIDSGNITQGMSWMHEFTTEETFSYHCHPHPNMMAQVVVSSTDPTAQSGMVNLTISGYAFHANRIVVKPGTMVQWTNLDNVTHTVTQEAAAAGISSLPAWQLWTVGLVVVATVPLFFLGRRKRKT